MLRAWVCKVTDSKDIRAGITLFKKIITMKTTTMASQSEELLKEKANTNRFSAILFAGIFALLGVVTALSVNGQKYHGKFYNNVDLNGVILNGYDPVAFFT